MTLYGAPNGTGVLLNRQEVLDVGNSLEKAVSEARYEFISIVMLSIQIHFKSSHQKRAHTTRLYRIHSSVAMPFHSLRGRRYYSCGQYDVRPWVILQGHPSGVIQSRFVRYSTQAHKKRGVGETLGILHVNGQLA